MTRPTAALNPFSLEKPTLISSSKNRDTHDANLSPDNAASVSDGVFPFAGIQPPPSPDPSKRFPAYTHTDHLHCPICKKQMADAHLPDGELVKFCPQHRITLPIPA